jgi:SAM-dependent methyltransferase
MYENGVLSQVTDGPLRPGGYEITRRMLELCCPAPEALILDAGCGSGATVEYLRELGYGRVYGIDSSIPLLRSAAQSGTRLSFVCARGESLPLVNRQACLIIAECSLSAMDHPDAVLAEFARLLAPGGWLAISDVYARSPAGLPALRALPFSCGLRNTSTQQEVSQRLQANGFERVIWEDHSEALKALAAQVTLTYGSVSGFWGQAEPAVSALDLQIALHKAQLGYYLLIARKKVDNG